MDRDRGWTEKKNLHQNGDRRQTTTTTSTIPPSNRDMDINSLRRTVETYRDGAGRQIDMANTQKIVGHCNTIEPIMDK